MGSCTLYRMEDAQKNSDGIRRKHNEINNNVNIRFYYPKAYRKTYIGVDMGAFSVLDFISTASYL